MSREEPGPKNDAATNSLGGYAGFLADVENHLEVEGQDYYLGLLFYHLKLRSCVVIDLKAVAFQPEFSGKMNFRASCGGNRQSDIIHFL